jgi:hypothetical protein
MDKSDFKVVYNLTKNFNKDEFKNILKKINDNNIDTNLIDIVNKNGKESVIKVINKINNFYSNLDESEDSVFISDASLTSSAHVLDTTPYLSETSQMGNSSATSSVFILDTTPYLSETSQMGNSTATSSAHVLDTTPYLSETSQMGNSTATSSAHVLDTTPYLSETSQMGNSTATPFLSETTYNQMFGGGNVSTSSEHVLDTTPYLTETSFDSEYKNQYNEIQDIENEIERLNNLGNDKLSTEIDNSKIDTIDNFVANLTAQEKLGDANKLLSELSNDESNVFNFI